MDVGALDLSRTKRDHLTLDALGNGVLDPALRMDIRSVSQIDDPHGRILSGAGSPILERVTTYLTPYGVSLMIRVARYERAYLLVEGSHA
jgi:hypothetical protein